VVLKRDQAITNVDPPKPINMLYSQLRRDCRHQEIDPAGKKQPAADASPGSNAAGNR